MAELAETNLRWKMKAKKLQAKKKELQELCLKLNPTRKGFPCRKTNVKTKRTKAGKK